MRRHAGERRRYTPVSCSGRGCCWRRSRALAAFLVVNAQTNLARRSLTFGFGFLARPAGFDIPFHIPAWLPSFSYGRALWVCLVNTLLVSALAIVTGSVLGLLLGIMRLSANWLVRNTALVDRRAGPQHAAADPARVLVRGRAPGPAVGPAEHRPAGQSLPQRTRPVRALGRSWPTGPSGCRRPSWPR